MNPVVKDLAYELLGSVPCAYLIPPLDYATFANLMARSYLVLTDSGGIQEEAPALGKPGSGTSHGNRTSRSSGGRHDEDCRG